VEIFSTKLTFEKYVTEHGIRILDYHCYNGQFHQSTFQQACHNVRQKLTFFGVNMHFQNGIAKQAICNLSESARKQLQCTLPCGRTLLL
jgi:hypothetical protein